MLRLKSLIAAVAVAGVLAMGQPLGAAGDASAIAQELGMVEVSVQVDGLSCPFCAYGLEKKLRKVENVARFDIQVAQGRAVIEPKPGTSVDLAALEQAVRDGGFTPRAVWVTARGRLTELNGAPALELPERTLLLLAKDAQTDALLKAARAQDPVGPVVKVEGQARLEQPTRHAGHPYTLRVRSFEVAC